MNRTLKTIIAGAAVAGLLISAPAALAQPVFEGNGPEGFRGRQRAGGMMKYLAEKLDLTEKQQEKLNELREENREKMKELRDAQLEKRRELRDELQKTDSDEGKIKGIVAGMKDLQSEQIDQRVDSFLDMKELLTPEQFEKFIEEGKQRRGKHGKRGRRGDAEGGNGKHHRGPREDES